MRVGRILCKMIIVDDEGLEKKRSMQKGYNHGKKAKGTSEVKEQKAVIMSTI